MLRLVSIILLATLATPAVAAPCAVQGMKPVVWNARSRATIPSDGGFVVMAVSEFRGEVTDRDVAVETAWRIRGRAPTIDLLAPGLAVYRAGETAGPVKLVDDKGAVLAEGTVVKSLARRPPVPQIKKIVRAMSTGRRTFTSISAIIDGDVPDGAIALVIATAAGKPISWGRAGASVTVYAAGGCAAQSPGTTAANVGDKVVAMWVDEFGQLSSPSSPITVAAP